MALSDKKKMVQVALPIELYNNIKAIQKTGSLSALLASFIELGFNLAVLAANKEIENFNKKED